MTTRTRFSPAIMVLIASAFSAGCTAQTDLDEYIEGQSGVASFSNDSPITVYLGGCNHFEQQERVDGRWFSRGGEFICLWEGLALPVPGDSVLDERFSARTEGVWRLAYDVGIGCSADLPLNAVNCRRIRHVFSPRLSVLAGAPSDQARCETTGGIWDVDSCGHYRCGDFPSCDAIIPGCDCGPFANFVDGQGCVDDASCVQACGGLLGLPCPIGTECFDQPGDSCGPLCVADCGGFCATQASTQLCGGFAGILCPTGLICIDDPIDSCDPDCGGADCGGICVDPVDPAAVTCGGLIGITCPEGTACSAPPACLACTGFCIPSH